MALFGFHLPLHFGRALGPDPTSLARQTRQFPFFLA
jgi:hypothetical protein